MNLVKKLGLSFLMFAAAFVADAGITFGDSYCFHEMIYFDGMSIELEKSCELEFYTSKDPYGGTIVSTDSIAVEVFGAKSKSEINPAIESLSCSETLTVEVLSDAEFRKKVMPPANTERNWEESCAWCSSHTPADISGMTDLEYRAVGWEYDEYFGDVYNEYDWPVELWPEHRPVEGRYWVVVTVKYANKKQWYGRSHFRIWQKGTNIKSQLLYLKYDDCDAWPMAFDYKNSRRGFSFDVKGHGVFGLDHHEAGLVAYNVVFNRYWLEHDKGPQPIKLPEAGILYLENTWYGMIDGYDITGADRARFTEYNSWDVDENLFCQSGCYNTTPGVWKIEVDSAKTIKIAENDDVGDEGWNEIEFSRIQFFPKAAKAVAVEAAFVSVNKYDYYPMVSGWWNVYLQGYVKGTGVYKVGETISLEAVSAPGEEFSHWKLLYGKFPSGVDTTNKLLTFKVTEDMAGTAEERKQMVVQAVWKEKYQVTATVSDLTTGKVTGSGFYHEGSKVVLKATANKGYMFSHWEGPLDDAMDPRSPSITYVVGEEDAQFVAYFVPASEGGSGSVVPSDASVYDGYLCNGDKVVGAIQVKVAKPKKGSAKVTVSIEVLGSKKVTVKGEMDVTTGIFAGTTKDGKAYSLTFNMNGVSGDFDGFDVAGYRDLFSSKDKVEKADAENALALWIAPLNMICEGGTLSVIVAKKGKVTVRGEINGVKVSAKAQALIGEDMICIPVVYSKKSVNLAFTVWLPIGGGDAEIVGFDGAIIGKAGMLKPNALFKIDGDILADIPSALTEIDGYALLPVGENVTASGSKWVVADGAKAAKVAYKKGEPTITEGKKNAGIANASGLKLTYKSKDGSFTGSFTVYALENNKLKKHKATVTGVLINGIGCGTATIKKIGRWNITIE